MSMISINFIKLTFYEGMLCENMCILDKNTVYFYNNYSNFFCNDIKLLHNHELVHKTFVELLWIYIYILKLNTAKDKDCKWFVYVQTVSIQMTAKSSLQLD